jgi:hypothetical protein
MVQPEELVERLRRRPFQPFLLRLTAGSAYEVRYPDMHLVCRTFMVLGIPEANRPDPFADHFEYIGISRISGIDPLPESSTAEPKPSA